MSEREYHDAHYAGEAARIFEGALFGRVHDRAVRDFLARTGAGKGHRLLSLGCGDGSLERRLAPHVGEILGVDVSAIAIAQARAKAAGLRNVSFAVSNGKPDSLLALGTFDVIAGFAFLHHLDDAGILATLRAARTSLRSGGTWYSADPSRRRLVRLFTPLVRRSYERYHSPDERELDPEALAGLALAAGFPPPQICYTDYFLGPLAWLAPNAPPLLARALERVDNAALALPVFRRYASSFSMVARVA